MKKQFLITKISKHLFYAMLVAVFFASCSYLDNNKDGAVVQSVWQWGETNSGRCQYHLRYDGDGFDIIDSSGKYKIGDTLYLGKKHCH